MRYAGAALLVAAAALVLWTTPAGAKKPRQLAASAQSQFGLDMYKTMTEQDRASNVFFSPLSICTALAMTYAGSEGDTARQMAGVLHFQGRRSVVIRGHRSLLRRLKKRYRDDVTLKMTNRMYAARRLRTRRRFSNYLSRMFGARVTRMAFGRPVIAAQKINSRVKEDTAGKIEKLIEPKMLNKLTRLMLVNAVYFKGAWATPFDAADTAPDTFHGLSGPLPVDMMTMQGRRPLAVGRVPGLRSRVLLLPYKGSKIHMMIILPHRRNGIYALEKGLTRTSLSEVFKKAKVTRSFTVKMPKFELDQRINLKRVLEAMGITDLFDRERANLTRISRGGRLYATDAIHKAVIEVNEEGSEAAAATGTTIGDRIAGPKPPPFIVDRPFFFALYDAGSDLTLFLGRVTQP